MSPLKIYYAMSLTVNVFFILEFILRKKKEKNIVRINCSLSVDEDSNIIIRREDDEVTK